MKRDDPVYGELRVKLPRFIIIGLRVMVDDANAKTRTASGGPSPCSSKSSS